ncbi:Zinc finger protein 532 [Amphibalanus amphitrite]|uniref:Zinc finger protein 532 n=1 Tax=Amphibalanus amphitrite TaxID=1232801 RepID=A0A6A4WXZ5_AMPAM|nr:zinc finger protein 592-like [Amphibalanus amphitrite]KAF0311775.1 Zinc finger protein 532 [Amphibalanus amphitrite]
MSSPEKMAVEPAEGGDESGPASSQEIGGSAQAANLTEEAAAEPESTTAQNPAPAPDQEASATPMEQDPPADSAVQPATETQPGKVEQVADEQPAPPTAEDPAPQPEVAEPVTEPAAISVLPPDQVSPPDPAALTMADAEEPPPPPPPPAEPVPVIPLNRTEMLNAVLAGRRSTTDIARLPNKLQLPLPREGFMCEQCGERFVLPSSLALHKNRRTMEIAFKCKITDKTCIFYNKCRFIEHLDSHGLEASSLDPESVDISALSAAELSSPTRVLPSLGARLITGPPRLVQMVHAEPERKPQDISCPMCNTLCNTDTLRAHICPSSSEALEAVPPRCPECAQPCPSECALLAHHGLHKPNLFPYPYVCPECGFKVLGSYDDYRRHVVAGCLHLTRDLKICCSVCLIEVGDVKLHMLQTHVQKLYKCRKCPLAFESINGFNSHVNVKHNGETMHGDTPYMPILKCPFCAATFNHPKTLRDHLASKKHGDRVLEQIRFVFRCPECGVDYGRKELLSDHLAQKHPEFQIAALESQHEYSSMAPSPPPAPTPPPPPPPPPAPVAPVQAPVAATKQAVSRSADTLPVPLPKIKQEPGRKPVVMHRCPVCQAEFRRKAAHTEHLRAHIQEGVPLCLLCTSAFESQELLKNHIAEHAAEIGSDRCGLCYAKLGSRDALQLHLETEHDLRDFTCPYCQLQFAALSDLLRHNFAKHRGAAQGRPARPKPPQPPAAGDAPAMDDDDDDDVPLSQMASKKALIRRVAGPLPGITSLHDLDSENSSVSEDASEGRRRRNGGRGGKGGTKRPRPAGEDGPPRLSRVKRSRSPIEEQPAAPQQQQQAGYRCVCCGLQTDVRADFVAHVALHRQGSQHQCPECGQCYSTKPSLLKHLLLVHRLREPPPEVAASEQQREIQQWEQLTRDLEPGQCHVCRAQCGDEERLQRHLRMHGRAALRAHQRDQARRQRRSQPAADADAETLEAIANFVAGSGDPPAEEEDGEEVIELEMKDGEVTRRQFRKGVPIVHEESSDEEMEVPAADNGQSVTESDQLAGKTALISANGHPEQAAVADPLSA